jgi:multicomponent Na+:H+ antiporter subunit C
MSILPYAVAAWIFVVGLYGIVSSRNLIHLVVCLTVVQSSTYVLLLAVGYKKEGTAPIFKDLPVREAARAVDPVVQALALTDIVVGVTVLGLLLALALDAYERTGTLDPDELHGIRG